MEGTPSEPLLDDIPRRGVHVRDEEAVAIRLSTDLIHHTIPYHHHYHQVGYYRYGWKVRTDG